MTDLAPVDLTDDLAAVADDLQRRILLTVSCRDSDGLERVAGAGEVVTVDGIPVQRMFQGVLIEEGCYFGEFTTPIVKGLHGVHEPQEEVVVDRLVRRLVEEQRAGTLGHDPVAVELGSFWAYYSIWFVTALARARAVAMEPDPAFLDVGRRNAGLNGVDAAMTFVHGAIAAGDEPTTTFTAESDGQDYRVDAFTLERLMQHAGVDHVDILFCDIQGFETPMLAQSAELLRRGAVRFLVISTHHYLISGDAMTHQRTLERLGELGAHVVAEHSVGESYSGDGLVVASFDPRDADLDVPVSHARVRDSLFGELEPHLAHAQHQRAMGELEVARLAQLTAGQEEDLAALRAETDELGAEGERLRTENASLHEQLAAVQRTRLWRWAQRPREIYSGLRRFRSRQQSGV